MNWIKKLNAAFHYMGLIQELMAIKERIKKALEEGTGWSYMINECIIPLVILLLNTLHLGHKTLAVVGLFNAIDNLISDKDVLARAEAWFKTTRASDEVRSVVAAARAVRDA